MDSHAEGQAPNDPQGDGPVEPGSVERRDTPSMTVGKVVNISKSSGEDAETSIIVNPTNPKNLFATSTAEFKEWFSMDGGLTWNASNDATSLGAGNAGDQQEAWDKWGNLFMTWFGGPNQDTILGVSTDGGATFKLLVDTGSLQDQPNVTANGSEVWFDYSARAAGRRRGRRSRDWGRSANSAAQNYQANFATFGDLASGPNGQVMAVNQENNGSARTGHMYMSLNPTGVGGTFGRRWTWG